MRLWVLFALLCLPLVSGATCYTGECVENTNCTITEYAVVGDGAGNLTPLTGASLSFQIWNNTGLVSGAQAMAEVGGGYYNATFNLTRGVYEARINGTYGSLNSSVNRQVLVVPVCYMFSLGGYNMDGFLLLGLLFLGACISIAGFAFKEFFLPIVGGTLVAWVGYEIVNNGLLLNFLVTNNMFTQMLGALFAAAGVGMAVYGIYRELS